MSDTVCVVKADCPEERGYFLRGGHSKIEAILGVEQLADFVVDSSVCVEEPRCELLSLIVIHPRVDCSWCNKHSSYTARSLFVTENNTIEPNTVATSRCNTDNIRFSKMTATSTISHCSDYPTL